MLASRMVGLCLTGGYNVRNVTFFMQNVRRTCRIQLALGPKKVANLMGVNGHCPYKRWWWSDKAVGVKNLDAI